MTEQISFTLPLLPVILRAHALMLTTLADGLVNESGADLLDGALKVRIERETIAAESDSPKPVGPPNQKVNESTGEVTDLPTTDPDPEAIFGKKAVPLSVFDEIPTTDSDEAPGVDLDADGVPWDERIHGSGQTKLVKTQQWKPKRRPNTQTKEHWAAYVIQVKTELLNVARIGTDPSPAVGPVPLSGGEVVPLPVATVGPVAATGTPAMDAPAFIAKVMEANLDQAELNVTLNAHGLANLGALMLPDNVHRIPEIDKLVFPNG